MAVDVVNEVEIARERSLIASYAADPDKATTWCQRIKSVKWPPQRPVRAGSRIVLARTAAIDLALVLAMAELGALTRRMAP